MKIYMIRSKIKIKNIYICMYAVSYMLCMQLVIYIYIYIYINIMRGKKGRNYISRQACFVNRFTLQGFNERIFM